MSVQALAAVFRHSKSKGSARLVLLALADVANDEGEVTAYKRSHTVLGAKANVSRASVNRAITDLTEMLPAELVVLRVGDGRASSDYQIVLPGLGEQDETPGVSRRDPCGPRVSPQGSQDETPIIPSSTDVGTSCSPPPTASAETGVELVLLDGGMPAESAPMQQRIEAVFAAWVAATGRQRTVLDGKRTRLIKRALDQYPLDDVVAAVRGWRHSPHHCGQNDRTTVYNDIELLLRDNGQVEKFRDLELGAAPAPMVMSRSTAAGVAWLSGARS